MTTAPPPEHTPPPAGPAQHPEPAPAARPVALRIPLVRPMLTQGLLGINILVFAAGLLIDLLFGGNFVRALLDGSQILLSLGAKNNQLIAAGQYWRFITPMFLHVGIIHLLFNSYFLYIVGPQLERPFGYVRFLLIYAGSGIAGAIASMIASPAPSAGASGALFGILGALAIFLHQNRANLGPMGERQFKAVLQVIAINLLLGIVVIKNIDNWGHIGGLIGGALLANFIAPRFERRLDYSGQPYIEDTNPLSDKTWAVALFGVGLTAAAAFAILLQ